MSTRFKAILVASHLLVVAAGGWLAWQSANTGGFFHPRAAASKPGKAAPASGRDLHGKAFFPTREWTGIEYARAWKAVRNGKYTTPERIRLQRDLLKPWAEVNLEAAIEAALGEAWASDGAGASDPSGPLLDVFAEALAKNPEEGWDMIRGRQFGVGTGMLRRVWMEAVGAADPLFLAQRLAELSWRDRDRAVEICRAAVQGRPDAAAELFKVFAALPAEMVSAQQLMDFTTLQDGPLDLVAMKQEITRLGGDDRMAKVKAMLLGKALAGNSADAIAGEIADLPDGVREEAVWAAFKDAAKPENVLGLADLLMDEAAWAKLEQRETVRQLQKIARDGAAREVAEWAISLPVRDETIELFHRSVETYLAENPKAAAAWLDAIPPGVWRDRAYAEYSQAALNIHHHPRASRWALNQIADATFKNEAESWRAQWEKRTGWTGK